MTQALIILRLLALLATKAGQGAGALLASSYAFATGAARDTWKFLVKLEAKLDRRIDRFVDTGWRRAFGWMGLAVAGFSYIYAPMHGLDIQYDAVNVFLTFSTGMYVTRAVEKHLRDRLGLPGGSSPMGPGAAAGH